jgi:hypothetical protein
LRQRLTERYRERVLSCYDRIIVTGTLPGACYAKGMMGFLSARQIRVFDYPRFAEPLRDRVRDRAAELASAAGVTIEHIAKKHIRREAVAAVTGQSRQCGFGLPNYQTDTLYSQIAGEWVVPALNGASDEAALPRDLCRYAGNGHSRSFPNADRRLDTVA